MEFPIALPTLPNGDSEGADAVQAGLTALRADLDGVVSELRQALAARDATIADMQARWDALWDNLDREADGHDYCSDYEEVALAHGHRGREYVWEDLSSERSRMRWRETLRLAREGNPFYRDVKGEDEDHG